VAQQLLFGTPARAAEPEAPTDIQRTTAEALFEAARDLMRAGKYAEASRKLEKSASLEDAPGTRLNLAWCHERMGRTATAWVNYKDALALAVQREDTVRQALARDRLAALEPRLSRLKVTLPEPRPAGAWLMIDDAALGTTSFDTNLPIDPGRHRLRAGAPGWGSVEIELSVEPGERAREVELPRLLRRPARADRAGAPASGERLRLVIAGSTLGLGIAGLASAGVFGLKASKAWDERNAQCRGGCNTAAVAAGESARTFAWSANIGAGVGLLGLAVGSYLLWTTPGGSTVALGVGPTRNGSLLNAGGSL
jgi:hypothetical protein